MITYAKKLPRKAGQFWPAHLFRPWTLTLRPLFEYSISSNTFPPHIFIAHELHLRKFNEASEIRVVLEVYAVRAGRANTGDYANGMYAGLVPLRLCFVL